MQGTHEENDSPDSSSDSDGSPTRRSPTQMNVC